jgi:hypothetical protein
MTREHHPCLASAAASNQCSSSALASAIGSAHLPRRGVSAGKRAELTSSAARVGARTARRDDELLLSAVRRHLALHTHQVAQARHVHSGAALTWRLGCGQNTERVRRRASVVLHSSLCTVRRVRAARAPASSSSCAFHSRHSAQPDPSSTGRVKRATVSGSANGFEQQPARSWALRTRACKAQELAC